MSGLYHSPLSHTHTPSLRLSLFAQNETNTTSHRFFFVQLPLTRSNVANTTSIEIYSNTPTRLLDSASQLSLCIHLYVYVCAHIIAHTNNYTYKYKCTFVCIYVHSYLHIYICEHIHTYMHTYIHIHIYVYIYIYIYILYCNTTHKWESHNLLSVLEGTQIPRYPNSNIYLSFSSTFTP